jgi:hypothetical protein
VSRLPTLQLLVLGELLKLQPGQAACTTYVRPQILTVKQTHGALVRLERRGLAERRHGLYWRATAVASAAS